MIYFHFRDAAYLRPQSEDKYSNKKINSARKKKKFFIPCAESNKKADQQNASRL